MNRGLLPPALAREGISPRDGGENYNTTGYKFAVRLLKSEREADNGKGYRRGTTEVKKNFKKREKRIDLSPQQTNKPTNTGRDHNNISALPCAPTGPAVPVNSVTALSDSRRPVAPGPGWRAGHAAPVLA